VSTALSGYPNRGIVLINHDGTFAILFQVEMLYQRYFLRMNQSNMTHVLGLLAGLALALALLLIVKLSLTGKQPLFSMLQRPENLSLAITLLTCIVVYAGNKSRPRRRKSLPVVFRGAQTRRLTRNTFASS